ncbi:MAG: hypoxanthine phosphoribosyltransferase [Bdellovibrionales bacterium]|nr:hypoxanthine phosphoribosyltransferase [Bdellovibrionales bacterium]
MSQLKDQMNIFLSADEIQNLVQDIARKIERDYAGSEVVMICPLKGSIHFIADLMRELKLPQTLDFVHLTSPKGHGVKIIQDISTEVENKHVLIIEEIIDAGRTLSFLYQRLLASNPASLKIVTLLDKPARRELSIKPDYCGKTIEDRYVIGYGLDSEELGRNYSDIYIFRN